MPKKQWEIDARDRFLKFLHEVEHQDYGPSAEDVVTNPLTGRDYDYEFAPLSQGPPIIALEIFRLVGDETERFAHEEDWPAAFGGGCRDSRAVAWYTEQCMT